MKKLMSLSIAILAIAHSYAQTADEVVNKYFDAIGGKEKMEAFKTLYTEGEMSVMNNPAPYTSSVVDGKASKTEMEFNGQKIVTCYTVGAGWTVNPLAGVTDPTPMPSSQVGMGPMTYDLKGPFYNYAAKGYTLELAGREKFNGADVFKLKLTTKDSVEMDSYIDVVSYYQVKLVVKTKVSGQPLEIAMVTSDYRKVNNGMMLPFVTEVSYPGLTVTSTSKIIEANKDIDPAIFVMPVK